MSDVQATAVGAAAPAGRPLAPPRAAAAVAAPTPARWRAGVTPGHRRGTVNVTRDQSRSDACIRATQAQAQAGTAGDSGTARVARAAAAGVTGCGRPRLEPEAARAIWNL